MRQQLNPAGFEFSVSPDMGRGKKKFPCFSRRSSKKNRMFGLQAASGRPAGLALEPHVHRAEDKSDIP
jgi:hypothetical protein